MSNIKWEEGAVSYAVGKQWNHVLNNEVILGIDDFQLNEIRIGDIQSTIAFLSLVFRMKILF